MGAEHQCRTCSDHVGRSALKLRELDDTSALKVILQRDLAGGTLFLASLVVSGISRCLPVNCQSQASVRPFGRSSPGRDALLPEFAPLPSGKTFEIPTS